MTPDQLEAIKQWRASLVGRLEIVGERSSPGYSNVIWATLQHEPDETPLISVEYPDAATMLMLTWLTHAPDNIDTLLDEVNRLRAALVAGSAQLAAARDDLQCAEIVLDARGYTVAAADIRARLDADLGAQGAALLQAARAVLGWEALMEMHGWDADLPEEEALLDAADALRAAGFTEGGSQ